MITLITVLNAFLYVPLAKATPPETFMIEELRKVCPREVYCRNASTVPAYNYPLGFDSCCSDCSCSEECVYDCCFPTEKHREYIVTKHDQCMFLTSRPPRKIHEIYYQSYHVIMEPPTSGCIKYTGKMAHDGSFDNLKPWGSKSPVFSKKFGKIFYNNSLAVCHGEQHAIAFVPFLSCNDHYGLPWGSNRYSLYVEGLKNPDTFKNCHIEFIYNGDQEDIAPQKCYRNLISTCLKIPFYVPQTLTMDTENIKKACTSGLLAPFTHNALYANPFCAICNGERDLHFSVCVQTGPDKTIAYSSMLALNNEIYVKYARKTNANSIEKVACKVRKLTLVGCRPILCPAGQLKAINDTCVWPFSNFRVLRVFSIYNLKPVENITIDDLRELTKGFTIKTIEWLKNPSPFTITKLAIFFTKDTLQLVDHLSVRMEINNDQTQMEDIPELLNTISISLRDVWEVYLKTRTVKLTPTLDGDIPAHDIRDTNDTLLVKYVKFDIMLTDSGELRFQLDKMFICEQIELKEKEFTLVSEETLMYHGNKTKTVFNENEFVVFTEDQNRRSVRICIEDSGFEVYEIGHSNCLKIYQPIFIVVSFFGLIKLVFYFI